MKTMYFFPFYLCHVKKNTRKNHQMLFIQSITMFTQIITMFTQYFKECQPFLLTFTTWFSKSWHRLNEPKLLVRLNYNFFNVLLSLHVNQDKCIWQRAISLPTINFQVGSTAWTFRWLQLQIRITYMYTNSLKLS